MAEDKQDVSLNKCRPYLPYLLSGASIAISCYSLYQSSQNKKSIQTNANKHQQISISESSKSPTFEAPIYSENEDVCGTASLSRLMAPDDANPSGNVHGGTILKMIGHVAWLSATRFINRNMKKSNEDSDLQYRGVGVRMESMDFKLPMYIGEICTCNARVTFTSNQSLETQVIFLQIIPMYYYINAFN